MRALLLACVGGIGSFAATTPGFAVTTAPDGATQPNNPSAYQYNGVVYLGYIDSAGNVKIRTINDDSGAVSSAVTLHAALEEDWHDVPSVLVRADGHIVVAYSKHGGAEMYVRISTNPEDISAWGTETNIDSQIAGNGNHYTYPTLMQLTGEASDPVYLFYRQNDPSDNAWWCLAKSLDGGVTWSTQVVVYRNDPKFINGHADSDGNTRIDFAFTSGLGSGEHGSVYHVYRVAGSYFKSDGSSAGSPTFGPADLTLVYDGSATGARYIASVTSSQLVVTFPDDDGGAETYYRCAWTGSAWTCASPADDGTTGATWVEGGYVSDHALPAYGYLSRSSGGHYSLARYHTADNSSFTRLAYVTSPSDDFYPVAIRNPGRLRVIWSRGTAVSYTNFSLGIMAGP